MRAILATTVGALAVTVFPSIPGSSTPAHTFTTPITAIRPTMNPLSRVGGKVTATSPGPRRLVLKSANNEFRDYSITSSASASKVGGTTMPSAPAVF